MMKNKILIITIVIFLLLCEQGLAQFEKVEKSSTVFFFDAICFNNDVDSLHAEGRVDVFVMLPYQTLEFERKQELFLAKYEVIIAIYDTLRNTIITENISGKVIEENYYVAQGGTAGFESISKNFFLSEGKYDVEVTIKDLFSNKTFIKSREINVIDFEKYRLAMSGIMLISSIEEIEGRFIITPHLNDNIASLSKGFFVFYELYNNKSDYNNIDIAFELFGLEKSDIIFKEKITEDIAETVTQNYKRIKIEEELNTGKYKLRIIALKPDSPEEYDESHYLAITERIINYSPQTTGYNVSDLDLAIKYLRYVANQSDIEYIESGANQTHRQKRFEEFWKNLDPTPKTDKNEAFDQYHSRIEYANKNYKSYNQGWLTDMGMVYIIFGSPAYIDHSNYYNSRGTNIKWTYHNNREFWFVDNTGLGDFRLSGSYPITEKYKYQ